MKNRVCVVPDSAPMTYPESVVSLYKAIQNQNDPVEREDLLVQLAATFASGVDRGNASFPEGLHELVENLDTTRQAYEQAGYRLARALLGGLSKFVEQTEPEVEKAIRVSDPRAN